MSTFALRQKLIAIATKEIGTVEIGASNTGVRVRQYQAATSLDGTNWPWCAAFVSWCVREWLKDAEVRAALKLTSAVAVEAWRPKLAAAYGFHQWAEDRGLLVMDDSPGNVLHTGDIVTYDFSHVGIVVTDEENVIHTIEGNTDGGGGRDGGGVWAKTRQRSLARKFIRMLP